VPYTVRFNRQVYQSLALRCKPRNLTIQEYLIDELGLAPPLDNRLSPISKLMVGETHTDFWADNEVEKYKQMQRIKRTISRLEKKHRKFRWAFHTNGHVITRMA
jgi:hypothetical protein